MESHNPFTVHQSIKPTYFHAIDAKEKAYWLGLLYADGFITRTQRAVQIRLRLRLDDEDTIDRFCRCLGLDKSKKEYRQEADGAAVEIRFACKQMSNDLIKNGFEFRKSRIVEFPILHQRRLELAFLLGYYDGDGQQNTTRISSGSIRFLEQVRGMFNLPYKIQENTGEKVIYGRKTVGTSYYLCLGSSVFKKMIANYLHSMPRKRWTPCDSNEKARRAASASTSEKKRARKEVQGSWRAITRSELQRIVWNMPSTLIAVNYGVTDKTVERKCRKFGILKPKRGYWAKRRSYEKAYARLTDLFQESKHSLNERTQNPLNSKITDTDRTSLV